MGPCDSRGTRWDAGAGPPTPEGSRGWLRGVLAAAACAPEPLAQFPGRRPRPGIPAVGVPALPAAVGGGILGAGGQFPPSHPPEPPCCAASFNSMGRGVPPEPAAPGSGQRPPTVAAEASSGCVGGSGCGEGALRPAPLSLRTRSSKSPALPRLSAPGGWVGVPRGSQLRAGCPCPARDQCQREAQGNNFQVVTPGPGSVAGHHGPQPRRCHEGQACPAVSVQLPGEG